MKKFLVTIALFLVLVGSVFAIPSKVSQRTYDDEVVTCWLNDTYIPIWTSNWTLEEQLEGLDYVCYNIDKEMTSYDKVYLIAKYGYIMRESKYYRHIETELDGHYVDYRIELAEEEQNKEEE